MSIRKGNSIIAGKGSPIPTQTGQSGKFLSTNGSNLSWENVEIEIPVDNETIINNTDNELQVVAVTDQNNTSTVLKQWSGTRAQFNNITVKDPNTIYSVTDDNTVDLSILDKIWRVGDIYITTNSTCPLQILGIGTWQLVGVDRVLQGAGTRGAVGTTINESLPNIKGDSHGNLAGGTTTRTDGAMTYTFATPTSAGGSGITYGRLTFDAHNSSSTYQDNAPVQQDAYLVNIFRRIA